MRVEVGTTTARVADATPEERGWLRSYLTFDDPQARFANTNRYIELVNAIDDTFPAGFAGKVRAAGMKASPAVEVTLVDVRSGPGPLADVDTNWLRPYQRESLEACLKRTRGIVQMPTGGGKTEVMAALVARVPTSWLILVPQADLLEQTAARIEARTGERPGIVGDGAWNPARVTVATFQTLHRRLTKGTREGRAQAEGLIRGARGMVVDECHTVAAGSLNLVTGRATNAYWRIGFSATPLDRSDRRSIFVVAQLGGIIHQTTSAQLRALGMLAEAKITLVRVEQGSRAPTWQGVYGECVVRSKARNAAVAQMAAVATKPALVFVSQVGHGQKLMPLLTKAGIRAELVWGEDSTDERRAALARLTAGTIDVVVCSSVFQQAVDIPSLRSVVNAAGGASIVQTLQRIGRGTRVTKDKSEFEVWDILDAGHRWLERHGRERQDVYEREGYKVAVVDSAPGAESVVETGRDEHGFVYGSAAADAHRAALRKAALNELAGVDRLRNPRRGRVLRPHRVAGYACTECGAPSDALPPECSGVRDAEGPPAQKALKL